jgi:hypothetical protein
MANHLLNWAMKQTDVKGPAKCVLIVLANRADKKTHQCFPSLTQIADDAGIDRSSVSRCLLHLLGIGKISRSKENSQKTVYALLGANSGRCSPQQVPTAVGAIGTKTPPVSIIPEPSTPVERETLVLGEHGRVRITPEENKKLLKKLNGSFDAYVADFDNWVAQAPDAKKDGVRRRDRDAYASICAWYSRDVKEGKTRKLPTPVQLQLNGASGLATFTTALCEICSPPHEWETREPYRDTHMLALACPNYREKLKGNK